MGFGIVRLQGAAAGYVYFYLAINGLLQQVKVFWQLSLFPNYYSGSFKRHILPLALCVGLSQASSEGHFYVVYHACSVVTFWISILPPLLCSTTVTMYRLYRCKTVYETPWNIETLKNQYLCHFAAAFQFYSAWCCGGCGVCGSSSRRPQCRGQSHPTRNTRGMGIAWNIDVNSEFRASVALIRMGSKITFFLTNTAFNCMLTYSHVLY